MSQTIKVQGTNSILQISLDNGTENSTKDHSYTI